MCKRLSLLIASFLCIAALASAGPITYDVIVNTSSIAGTAGALDFNFNPGPSTTQAASLQILNFTSNGTLAGSPALIGDVTGALPSALTFDNGTAFNDYFQGFTYGSALSFDVSLSGPALSSPDGTSASGSAFAFSMFSDPAGTIPTLTTDVTDGFAATIGVNLDGTTTPSNYSSQTTISAVNTSPSPVPEPGSLLLVGGGGLAALWRKRRRA